LERDEKHPWNLVQVMLAEGMAVSQGLWFSLASFFVVDATGHDTEVVAILERKMPGKLRTSSGNREGEEFMDPEEAEEMTLKNTQEVFPGLYVAGVACNAWG